MPVLNSPVLKAPVVKAPVLAVLLAVGVLGAAEGAWGQMRAGDDGRAGEASNRVGSGGYNSPRPNLQLASPNDIALGNVTSGRSFRGNITGDPRQPFGGRSNLPSDRFNRASNPVTPSGIPVATPGAVQQYYSTSPVGNAPAGFVFNPLISRYQPAQGITPGALDIDYGTPPGTPVVRPEAGGTDQLVLPTMLRDETGALTPTVLTATPLLGLRVSSDLADQDSYLLTRSSDPRKAAGEIDASTLRKLREELRDTLRTDPLLAEKFRRAESQVQQQEASRTSPLQRDAEVTARPLGASVRRDVTPSPVDPRNPLAPVEPAATGTENAGGVGADAQIPGARAFNDSTGPQNSTRNLLLGELRRAEQARREAAAKREKSDPNRPPEQIRPEQVRPGGGARGGAGGAGGADAGEAPAKEAVAGGGGAATRPVVESERPGAGVSMRSDLPESQVPQNVGYVPPVKVGSLAEQQTSGGLKQLIGGAEELLKQGRYASAADRFEAATRFAPGDATVTVGRAQAELAAGFFARAEASLRGAFTADPAILNAQYDLRKSIGDARVDQLVGDLKRIATEEKRSATPVLLLAYLAFNSGNPERAGELLTEAAARRPGDPLIEAMRERWTTGQNK